MNDRELAVRTLFSIHLDGELCHKALARALTDADKNSQNNKAWVTRVVNGVTERLLTLDYLIEKQSGRKPEKIKPRIRIILDTGLYQALFMSVPESAAVNESVKLAKKFGFSGLSGFVNGVLRGCLRSFKESGCQSAEDYLKALLKDCETAEKFEKLYSVPRFITASYLDYMGPEEAERVFSEMLDDSKPVSLYRLSSRCGEEEFETSLEKDGVEFEKINDLPNAYVLKSSVSISELEAFKKGWFIVQDQSSMRASELLPVHSGAQALDVCAAPGGKAVHMADRLAESDGRIIACDKDEGKVSLINDTIKRCGLDNIVSVSADALCDIKEYHDRFDLLTADLPCSGLGVIGRKPDIKYKTKEEDIRELAGLQRRMLANIAHYVKSGGHMVFSTCTLAKKENEKNADYIKTLGFTEIKREVMLPSGSQDGFFAALFKKN